MSQLSFKDEAIKLALQQNWKEAIQVNLQILKEDKQNIDALNRLGYAYMKNNQPIKSKETFTKLLKIDPFNLLAQKNIKKINIMKKSGNDTCGCEDISPLLFLEEPGKTKLINCVNIAPMNSISTLACGQKIQLVPKNHSVEVRDTKNKYIGALPDDLAFRLLKLINAGNEYAVHVKGVSKNCVSIFIRETKRGKRLINQPSFIGTTNYIPYQRPSDDKKSKNSDEEETENETTEENN